MKILLVANCNKKNKRYNKQNIDILLRAQVENSLELGWKPEDIILLANFKWKFIGVKSWRIELNDFCLTGSKMFGMHWLFANGLVKETIWAKDCDVWQNVAFDEPKFKQDVGASQYSRPKFNGGSIFWKPAAQDIVYDFVDRCKKDNLQREEPLLNEMFKSKQYRKRVATLNETYNVGCSGFVPRYNRSVKPIHALHFHPYNRIAWETHVLDRNGLDEVPITPRLENLLRRYYTNLATKLSEQGWEKAERLRIARLQAIQDEANTPVTAAMVAAAG